ncbi:hypothetical protein ACFLUV_00915 [Elusimicrobiota bacterium]
MMTGKKYPAVILGMSANGLSIARSLGKRGIPIYGVSSSSGAPGSFSKYVTHLLSPPSVVYEKEKFLDFMMSLGKEINEKSMLFITDDEYIMTISQYRDTLSQYYNFALPPHDLVEKMLGKSESYKLTMDNNMLSPLTYFIDDDSKLEDIADRMKYPCIIKPQLSHLWREEYGEKKVFVVNTKKELIEAYKETSRHGLKVIIQEIIPGDEDGIYEFSAFFNSESEPLAYFCCRKIRQYPPDFGIASMCVSEYRKDIVELSVDFLRRIKYQGLVEIEYKLHEETKAPVFIEANIRSSFIGELSIVSGIDLPYIAYMNIMRGYNEKEPANFTFEDGIKLLNIKLDIGTFFRRRKNNPINLVDWIMSYRAPKYAHTYFSLYDLKPFLAVYYEFVINKIRRLLNCIRKIKTEK